MKSSIIKINNNREKGFAVLFSILLASFLITLGISIFTISLKEIQIATSARDSQIAYYVADSARECALYWGAKQGVFPICLDDTCTNKNTPIFSPRVTCNGNDVTLGFTRDQIIPLSFTTGSLPIPSFFQASSVSSSTPVADVQITTINDDGRVVFTIKSYGHNTSIIGRRVERGISQSYP